MDRVNHPAHYNQGKFETIEIIEDITGDGFEGYLLGNIIKYLARYRYKNRRGKEIFGINKKQVKLSENLEGLE